MPGMHKRKQRKDSYTEKPKNSSIYTPKCLADFISRVVLHSTNVQFDLEGYPRKNFIVYDICCGEGALLEPFLKLGSVWDVILYSENTYIIDIDQNCINSCKKRFEIPDRNCFNIDFLNLDYNQEYIWGTFNPPKPDLILCNPPFNGHPKGLLYPEEMLIHMIELWGTSIPIILFIPDGVRLNKSCRNKSGIEKIKWYNKNVNITGIISLPKDIYPSIKDKSGVYSEILLINITGCKTHYFYYPEEELK